MADKAFYFAYGSNMNTPQLRKRAPSAQPVGQGWLADSKLVCNKRSIDGSGKANLVRSPGNVVWGVLFNIRQDELLALDEAEGGYKRVKWAIHLENSESVFAWVYVARPDRVTDYPVPYDWYKKLIVEAAREHGLPTDYVEMLEALPSKPDRRQGSGEN